ncbi:hypothetical protein JRQ81_015893 [Phrynocephalus forsythii]|uniref:Uncharacterized protein n=1 Tax=Phrynocephalus forsythii TaxID=171643 RepID=A0A9Q1B2J5_9SAUR|nr:hypothetical protein JRQ81_015893 [Phrynocephalus forsythii]
MAVAQSSIQHHHYEPAVEPMEPSTTSATALPKQASFHSQLQSAKEARPAIPSAFLASVANIQAKAQAHLLAAITCERAKRWFQAIEHYRKLLNSLSKKKFPPEYVPGPQCSKLVFETYYHIGVAFQKVDYHRDASEEFTNAIESGNPPKVACNIGCASIPFYQTPAFARRAYAYVKCDKIKEAIGDATRAVHLDPSNPDVYCIRALVWSSVKEKRRALLDLNLSFRLNASHVCTLILRGAILKSLGGVSASEQNKDHEKALKLCRESMHFFDVEDFHNPKMPSFYDKFLWSLNAFHTITEINLFVGASFVPNSKQPNKVLDEPERKPFRCGCVPPYSSSSSSSSNLLLWRKTSARAVVASTTGINGNNCINCYIKY